MRLKQKSLFYRKNLQIKKQILLQREDPDKFSWCYIVQAILTLSGLTNAKEQNNLSPRETNLFQLSPSKFRMCIF
jgi:hypothetical protein